MKLWSKAIQEDLISMKRLAVIYILRIAVSVSRYEFQSALGEPVKEGVCREPEALSLLATDSSAALVSILVSRTPQPSMIGDRQPTTIGYTKCTHPGSRD
jgi:hypothetical protein